MAKKDERASINIIIKAVEARDILLRRSEKLSNNSPDKAAINPRKIRARKRSKIFKTTNQDSALKKNCRD